MLMFPLNFISKHTDAFGVKLSLACFMLFDIVFYECGYNTTVSCQSINVKII